MARKQKMKIYHGIPKSIIDDHTIFYASFDGIIDPSVGTIIEKPKVLNFKQMNTGYGICSNGGSSFRIQERKSIYSRFSLNFWLNIAEFYNINSEYPEIISLQLGDIVNKANSALKIYFSRVTSRIYCEIYTRDGYSALTIIPNVRQDNNLPDNCYIRLDCDGDVITPYYNGMKQPSLSNLKSETTFRDFDTVVVHSSRLISDLHISNIDRGDYFPNLPQDFIEGKAIIKPRMGQQQIKGDPMYSQVTTVKIPAGDWGDKHPYAIIDPRHAMLRTNPEILVSDSLNWSETSTIEISGLNGEIISGLIDENTALAKVVNRISRSKYVLNTVEGISPMDKIRFYIGTSSSPECTISEVDTNNNIIILNQDLTGWDALPGYFVIETTSSSSSPIVKRNDGVDVDGTWSGLGTTKATFTLGSNPDIQGKDFYIKYALIMSYGNSDFSEIPYSVERAWGENGLELVPVKEIVVVDDFKGKKAKNVDDCPHFYAWSGNNALMEISDSEGNSNDLQKYYDLLSKLDNNVEVVEVSTNTGRAQQRYSFNIVEIVERKIGEIPSHDKIQWLKNNIRRIQCNLHGYGKCPSGNKLYLAGYGVGIKTWAVINSHTTSSISLIQGNLSTMNITPTGFSHFLAYSDPSNGTINSYVGIDYVSIEITLQNDSEYTILYSDNKRAREDKCNPVLVQKETKTVKRYFPSKECFTTECTKLPYKDVSKVEAGKILSLLPYKIVTSNGTAGLTRDARGVDNYTDKVFLPSGYKPYQYDSSPIVVSETDNINAVSHTVKLPTIRYWGGRRYHGAGSISMGLDSSQTITTKSDIDGKPMYELTAGLKNNNGQLEMVVITTTRPAHNTEPAYNAISNDYILPNRPLIK